MYLSFAFSMFILIFAESRIYPFLATNTSVPVFINVMSLVKFYIVNVVFSVFEI